MDYHIDLPYPPIKVRGENTKFADLILLNYAGSVSELSAVTQYTYLLMKSTITKRTSS